MIAEDPVNAPTVTAGASATLVGLLVDEGKLDEASSGWRSTATCSRWMSTRN